MTQEKPLPCPFCGEKDALREHEECENILVTCFACEASAWKDIWKTRATQVTFNQFAAECRDALTVALQYMEGSGFSSIYARNQVKEQIQRCQLAIDQQVTPTTEKVE